MKKILLIEDDYEFRQLLKGILVPDYNVVEADNVKNAKEAIFKDNFDLFLVDIELPDGSGIELCGFINQYENSAGKPLIIVSGKDEVELKVTTLDLGANDYIVKPFNKKEFLARVRSQLKNRSSLDRNFQVDCFLVNEASHQVFLTHSSKQSEVLLSPVEYKILLNFLKSPGRTFSRDQLLSIVSGLNNFVSDRSIDTHVCSIRKKLGKTVGKKIKTIYGYGYLYQSN